MININELRRLAQAATPGPWQVIPVGDGRQKFAVADSEFLSILTVTDEGDATFGTVYDDADAEFIAASNPAAISELLDRLEAAEKAVTEAYQRGYATGQEEIEAERDALRAAVRHEADCVDAAKAEIDALRTKIEQMEKQEPVAFGLYSGWALKATYLKEHEACEQRDRRQLTADLGGSLEAYRVAPLYALPGAQQRGDDNDAYTDLLKEEDE